MTEDVTAAVLRLQTSLMHGRLKPWRAEQTEEALNGLLKHPNRTGNPYHLERNALSEARKKLQRRDQLLGEHMAEIDVMAETGSLTEASDGDGYDVLRSDVIDSVRRTSSEPDRKILAVALGGGSARDVAEAIGIPYDAAKVRLSRARQRARTAWQGA
jgi:DNA-directed RNA polymerase specialized sigma24 family protein